MGQYYLIVKIDKRRYLNPSRCGDGRKLMGFASSGVGVLAALAILLADGNGRGGGDLRSGRSIVGSWAGDRIVIAGDYADEGRLTAEPTSNLYRAASDGFEDVSRPALRALADDGWFADEMRRLHTWQGEESVTVYDYAMNLPEPGESLALDLMPANDR